MTRFSIRVSIILIALAAAPMAVAETPSADHLVLPPAERSGISKLSSSMKSGLDKVATSLTPSTKEAVDPISLSVPAKPSADFHTSLARMAEESGNIAKAEEHFLEALKLDPKHVQTLLAYGHMVDRQGKLEKAAELYHRAIEADPTNASARNDLGICRARQGKLKEAVASLEKATELNPSQGLYRNNIATVLVEMGRIDEAFTHLKAVHPDSVACYNMGYLLHKAGDNQGAMRMFAEAVSKNPSMTSARVWLERLRSASERETRQKPQSVAQRPVLKAPAPRVAAPMPPDFRQLPQDGPSRPASRPDDSRAVAPLPPVVNQFRR